MAEEEEEEEERCLNSIRPSQKYPKSDAESSKLASHILPPKRHETSSKCLVHTLLVVVLLSIAFLVFGLVVLRVTAPSVRLSSVTITNLSYSWSPEAASLNMTFVAQIRVGNKNFGSFRFGDGNTALLYGNTTIGVANIYGRGIGSRKREGINVTMDVTWGDFVHANPNFSKDFDSGLLRLMGFTELTGEIHVIKIMNRRRTAVMNCSMDLNLTRQAVQDLLCH